MKSFEFPLQTIELRVCDHILSNDSHPNRQEMKDNGEVFLRCLQRRYCHISVPKKTSCHCTLSWDQGLELDLQMQELSLFYILEDPLEYYIPGRSMVQPGTDNSRPQCTRSVRREELKRRYVPAVRCRVSSEFRR